MKIVNKPKSTVPAPKKVFSMHPTSAANTLNPTPTPAPIFINHGNINININISDKDQLSHLNNQELSNLIYQNMVQQ
jgi:hypothetical protein